MAENRVKLTNRRVAELVNPNGQLLWVYDTDTPGFAVTISPRGKREFYFVGRVHSRPRRVKLGVHPGLSVDEARKACRRIIGDVAAGRAVADRKRQGRATVGELWEPVIACCRDHRATAREATGPL